MLESTIDMNEEGITVPYAPLFDDVRQNQGFVDARGRPDLASRIVEGTQSKAMRDLLVRLAHPNSRIFSIGCDVGKEYVMDEGDLYHTAGGYIQIMETIYSNRTPEKYAQYGEAVVELVDDRSRSHKWRLDLLLTPVQFNLDDFDKMTGSLWLWFHAYGDTEERAVASREKYIKHLGRCLFDRRALACFS